ncbi:MAG: hypothetical protein HY016_04060 [Nitrosomonadales bacterium]|nr:hypothetical protein [Nitrosomonadales bacterium]
MRHACLIALLTMGLNSIPVCATEMGRLFFTPEKRAQLDQGLARESKSNHPDSGLLLNGIVQKHGGSRTAWINGKPRLIGSSDEKSPESLSVPLPGQSKPIRIKVGQKISTPPDAAGK